MIIFNELNMYLTSKLPNNSRTGCQADHILEAVACLELEHNISVSTVKCMETGHHQQL